MVTIPILQIHREAMQTLILRREADDMQTRNFFGVGTNGQERETDNHFVNTTMLTNAATTSRTEEISCQVFKMILHGFQILIAIFSEMDTGFFPKYAVINVGVLQRISTRLATSNDLHKTVCNQSRNQQTILQIVIATRDHHVHDLRSNMWAVVIFQEAIDALSSSSMPMNEGSPET
jgi:hypothetical protein